MSSQPGFGLRRAPRTMLAALVACLIVVSSAPLEAETLAALVGRFDRFERDVMFGRLPRKEARKQLLTLLTKIREATKGHALLVAPVPNVWRFPIEGGARHINVGGKGSGFRPKRPAPSYDFYDGNRHGGHPAHDLFIHDRDRDCRDDRTSKSVRTLAMVAGIVVAVNLDYKPGLPRGGATSGSTTPGSTSSSTTRTSMPCTSRSARF